MGHFTSRVFLRFLKMFNWGLTMNCVLGLLASFFLFSSFFVQGAEKDFSSWRRFSSGSLVAETTAVAPGASATIGLKIELEPGWHTYWANPGDSGAPLHLNFNNGIGVKVNRVLMPFPKRFETGPLISFGYEKEVLFPIDLQIGSDLKPGQTAHVEVEAEWLVCEAVCIPAFERMSLDVPVGTMNEIKPSEHFNAFQRARSHVPKIQTAKAGLHYVNDGNLLTLTIPDWPADRDFVDFFPYKSSGVTNEAPQVKLIPPANGRSAVLELKLNKSNVPSAAADRVGVLVSRRHPGGQMEARQFGESGWSFDESHARSDARARTSSLLWMLLSAFLGGLILNLMPCVFPILSIKLLSLLKLSEAHPREVRVQNGAYVFGVLISFISIALLLSLFRSAGNLVGWGFQLQSPLFLIFLGWLFFALALNLMGVFEVDLLNAGFGHRLTRFGGVWGSFFTGVLAVVVASPCTAPFMGVAIGFGLAQPTYILLAIFSALGLGLAFPYIVFAIFPHWIRVLPKPGVWMNRVKQAMAVPLLLTDAWLIWILSQMSGSTPIVLVIAGCVSFALVFASKGWLKTFLKFATVVIMAGGLIYIYRAEQTKSRESQSESGAGKDWMPYSRALMESLKGKSVFVNMTADWCLSCKVNERLVFSDPEVLALLKKKGIALVKGDWTQQNEEITLFLNRFERVGVPFYVLYSAQHPDGQVLPEVLTKSTFIERITKEFPERQ